MSEQTADRNITPDELVELRPLRFLRGQGPTNDEGKPRDDLTGLFASAACTTFERAELSPQELATTYEAVKQCLGISDEPKPGPRFRKGVDHALDVCAELLAKEPNDALVDWIYEWFPLVESDAGIEAFHKHMNAVVTQYALIQSLKAGR